MDEPLNNILDFDHFKKTGQVIQAKEDNSEYKLIEERLEQLVLCLELSTDEILLEISNRQDDHGDSYSMRSSIPIEFLIEELGYRSSVIDEVLLKAVQKLSSEK